jgi:hypothetical protein
MPADSDLAILSQTVYLKCLRLYPAPYRREYGPLMAQLFHDLCREAYQRKKVLGLAQLWLCVLIDLGISTSREHLAELRRSFMIQKLTTVRTRAFWIIASAVTIAAGLLTKVIILELGGPPFLAFLIMIGANVIAALMMEFVTHSGGVVLLAAGLMLISLLLPLWWVPDGVQWLRANPAVGGIILIISAPWVRTTGGRWALLGVALILSMAQIAVSFL